MWFEMISELVLEPVNRPAILEYMVQLAYPPYAAGFGVTEDVHCQQTNAQLSLPAR